MTVRIAFEPIAREVSLDVLELVARVDGGAELRIRDLDRDERFAAREAMRAGDLVLVAGVLVRRVGPGAPDIEHRPMWRGGYHKRAGSTIAIAPVEESTARASSTEPPAGDAWRDARPVAPSPATVRPAVEHRERKGEGGPGGSARYTPGGNGEVRGPRTPLKDADVQKSNIPPRPQPARRPGRPHGARAVTADEVIVALARHPGGVHVKALAREIGRARPSVGRVLRELASEGRAVRSGGLRGPTVSYAPAMAPEVV